MPRTKNQKINDFVMSLSYGICVVLQIFFPVLKHNPSISIVQNLHTGVIKAGGQTYFSHEILSSATIKIPDAGVFSRGFLTDDHFNAIITLALQSTLLAVVILLILKKPVRQMIIFSVISLIILYGIGYIYTYRWFQINGGALAQAGYKLALPFGKDVFYFILIAGLLYNWESKTRPQKSAFE